MNITEIYWDWVPYDWRLGQIWYRLTCWAWHRHTTIKPRYLNHTWHDRTELMPNMMFEILCQFVEKECSPGHIEWYGENAHKITVGGVEKYVMDEMKELVEWWHKVWNKEYQEVNDMLWAEASKHSPTREFIDIPGTDFVEWLPEFKTEEDKVINHNCLMAMNKLERNMQEALEDRLHRIIPITFYMWT